MRALLTGGIKAILAIAALSTAAHWAMRVQREAPGPAQAMAAIPDPAITGSIEPRRVERPVASAPAPVPAAAGLDQTHLAALMAGAAPARPKPVKPAAEKVAQAPKAAPVQKAAVAPKPAVPVKPAAPAKTAAATKVVASADRPAVRH